MEGAEIIIPMAKIMTYIVPRLKEVNDIIGTCSDGAIPTLFLYVSICLISAPLGLRI